jgi:hypothetical protein
LADPRTPRTSPLVKLAAALAAAVVLFLAAEGLASVARAAAEARGARAAAEVEEERHCEHDPDLGWMNRPNLAIDGMYGPGTSFTTNAQRLRATREYTAEIPAGRYRIVCLGDSFTMGYGVGDGDTFPARLEALSPRYEVINMGLGGFGLDQDYLWYLRDGVRFETDLLLLLLIPDDFNRVLTDLFLGRNPKPVLELAEGELRAANVPVPERFGRGGGPSLVARTARGLDLARLLGAGPAPGSAEPGALAFVPVAGRILAELRDLSRERGQGFAVVYLPPGPLFVQTETRLPAIQWLEQFTARESIPYHDLTGAFDAVPKDELPACFAHGHYSPRGNALVAAALAEIVARDHDRP